MIRNTPSNDDPVVVQVGSGWWNGMGGYSIARTAFVIDMAKVAKARADAAEVAVLMGWK